jgi:hypothetical protein
MRNYLVAIVMTSRGKVLGRHLVEETAYELQEAVSQAAYRTLASYDVIPDIRYRCVYVAPLSGLAYALAEELVDQYCLNVTPAVTVA